jgi:hypothetical protein
VVGIPSEMVTPVRDRVNGRRLVVIADTQPVFRRFLRSQPHLNPRGVIPLTATPGRRVQGVLGCTVVLVYVAESAKAAAAHAHDLAALRDEGALEAAG